MGEGDAPSLYPLTPALSPKYGEREKSVLNEGSPLPLGEGQGEGVFLHGGAGAFSHAHRGYYFTPIYIVIAYLVSI
jgi:hypothetical protein